MASDAMSTGRARLVLISKTKTSNLGNVALTTELVHATSARAQGRMSVTVSVMGRPSGLQMYDREFLRRYGAGELMARAARLGRALRVARVSSKACASRQDPVGMPERRSTPVVERITLNSGHLRQEWLRTPLRRVAAKFRALPLWPTYLRRLSRLLAADLVAYSGAGEIVDNDIVVRQLFELSLLMSAGVPVMPLNQSVDVNDSAIRELLGAVYSKADAVFVRGEASRRLLIELGVPADRVQLAADTAFLISELGEARRREGAPPRAAVVLNGTFQRPGHEAAVALCRELKSAGFEVELTSSDWPNDRAFLSRVAVASGTCIREPPSDYQEYARRMAACDVVVSNRLHSCVMAMAAGSAVVPISMGHHKTDEEFGLIRYPVSVVDGAAPDLSFRVLQAVRDAVRARDEGGIALAYRRGADTATAQIDEMLRMAVRVAS